MTNREARDDDRYDLTEYAFGREWHCWKMLMHLYIIKILQLLPRKMIGLLIFVGHDKD